MALPRRDECIIHRLRIGHILILLMDGFILRNEEPPECIACQMPLTVDHTGLAGNVAVDTAEKAALNLAESQTPVSFSDFYPLINTHIASHWQRLWNANTNNKLYSIEPRVNISKPYQLPRRDELIIHRLRIGHTHLTHGFLLKREVPPECIGCQTPLTVEHILLNCIEFQLIRVKYYTCTNLSELFSNVPPRAIVDFIKEIGLYRKL